MSSSPTEIVIGAIRVLTQTVDRKESADAEVRAMAEQAMTTSTETADRIVTQAQAVTALREVAARAQAMIAEAETVHADLRRAMPAFGEQVTTALAVLATKDYTVPLSHAMPSATYHAAVVVPPAFAGKMDARVISQTASTVTVRTQALVAVGTASFAVVAWV